MTESKNLIWALWGWMWLPIVLLAYVLFILCYAIGYGAESAIDLHQMLWCEDEPQDPPEQG